MATRNKKVMTKKQEASRKAKIARLLAAYDDARDEMVEAFATIQELKERKSRIAREVMNVGGKGAVFEYRGQYVTATNKGHGHVGMKVVMHKVPEKIG